MSTVGEEQERENNGIAINLLEQIKVPKEG